MTLPTMNPTLLASLMSAHKPSIAETDKGPVLLTGPARLMFAQLAEPKANDSGVALYSGALVLPETADVSAVLGMVGAIGKKEFGDKFGALIEAGQLACAVKSQAKKVKKMTTDRYEGFGASGYYIDFKSMFPPHFWNAAGGKATPDLFYSGCWVMAQLAFAYKKPAKPTHKPSIMASCQHLTIIAHDKKIEGEGPKNLMGAIAVHPGASAAPVSAGGPTNWGANL